MPFQKRPSRSSLASQGVDRVKPNCWNLSNVRGGHVTDIVFPHLRSFVTQKHDNYELE